MPYPKQLGAPCWEKEQADKCINYVAQVTPEQAPLFLATHSPIKNAPIKGLLCIAGCAF